MSKSQQRRLYIVAVLILLLGLIAIGKLFWVQVLHGKEFAARADRQYVTPETTLYDRGSIYFTTKTGEKVSAASLATGYKVALVPKRISEPKALYDELQVYLDIKQDAFIEQASKKNDPYEEIAHKLDKTVAEKIQAIEHAGVQVYKERWRIYPGDDLAAHTIGFVGYEDDTLQGQYGLERAFDKVLQRGNSDLYVNFFAEVFANLNELFSGSSTQEGNVITTIEPNVQSHVENTIDSIQKKWDSKRTGAIVINPNDGSLYAMASTPSFNPNKFNKVDDVSRFTNPHTQHVYEMGSTMKPLIMASALETDAVTPGTQYYDSGSVTVEGHTIYNYDKKGRGQATMQDVLNHSLNTGMVYVSQQMKRDQLREYFKRFNFGEETSISLPGEINGLVSNLSSNRKIEFANMAFGQGIAVTPVGMIRALSALANGGKLVHPHVVDKIAYNQGFKKNMKYEKGDRVFEEETTNEITRMLIEVVDSTLLGGNAELKHYSIAAKTGTAQVSAPDGGYYENRNLHSFFGYFPAHDPKFLVFFYTMHPKDVQYSSQTLAEPFMSTARFLLHYYNVPPDRSPAVGSDSNGTS